MARHTAHRDRSDSPQRKSNMLAMMQGGLALPAGCTLANDEERALWGMYTQARAPDDWRESDLPSVHKIVKLEMLIRAESQLLYEEGTVLLGATGRMVKNPRLAALVSLQQLQLHLARALKIHVVDNPSSMASRARDAKQLFAASDPLCELLNGR
ncbi:hypothetical protein IB229_00205 [Pseudomonas sp. PDM14]|uniref:hypothetical protein n=1 Tax=Pseudomonas sp. PDM14 TaxID=2769288 RepID=UPI001784945B|nr:hypothetical protein [Pseudomonas sp. PDM14]MBD9481379.1 hypothetical protein [Pseudomonas sp. PDM14]